MLLPLTGSRSCCDPNLSQEASLSSPNTQKVGIGRQDSNLKLSSEAPGLAPVHLPRTLCQQLSQVRRLLRLAKKPGVDITKIFCGPTLWRIVTFQVPTYCCNLPTKQIST